MTQERLQKLIAQAGVASRRAAEALITDGRVRVNGRIVTTLGAKADPVKDKVEVDGRRLVAEKPAYYLLHKPRGVVTTLDDPEGRDTIATLLKGIPERVFPVGRLDYHTSGVLLITNDGGMAQALLHPKKTVPKTYVAKVRGHMEVPQLDALRNGVELGGGETTRKAEVFVIREDGGNAWIQLTITEGKNRQIHRMVEAVDSRVGRLARVAFAGLTLEGLRPGEYRELKGTELQKLKRDYLNPKKKAVAEEVRQQALDAAMFSLGLDAGDDSLGQGEDDEFSSSPTTPAEAGDSERGPIPAPFTRRTRPRTSKPRTSRPTSGDSQGQSDKRSGGSSVRSGASRSAPARRGKPGPGRGQELGAAKSRVGNGPAVEVMTMRRGSTRPAEARTPAWSPKPGGVNRASQTNRSAPRDVPAEERSEASKRRVRKVVSPKGIVTDGTRPKKTTRTSIRRHKP